MEVIKNDSHFRDYILIKKRVDTTNNSEDSVFEWDETCSLYIRQYLSHRSHTHTHTHTHVCLCIKACYRSVFGLTGSID